MRNRLSALVILLVVVLAIPLHAQSYRYAAVCDGNLCLVSADGASKLVIAKPEGEMTWEGLAVSPISGTLVALMSGGTDESPSNIYEVNPADGSKRQIAAGAGYTIPEYPVWLDDQTFLLQKYGPTGSNAGVFSLNTKNGALKQVVPPIQSESSYDQLLPSPSDKLIATTLVTQGAGMVSVNDATAGKRLWSSAGKGMPGFSGAAWSADGESLVLSFYKESSKKDSGGLWKADASTGKRQVWKYAGEDISGVWSSPNAKTVAVKRSKSVDYLNSSDGKLLYSVPMSTGEVTAVFFPSPGGSIVCTPDRVLLVNSSGKVTNTYNVESISSEGVKYSPSRNALIYVGAGAIDLATGNITKFTNGYWNVEWL